MATTLAEQFKALPEDDRNAAHSAVHAAFANVLLKKHRIIAVEINDGYFTFSDGSVYGFDEYELTWTAEEWKATMRDERREATLEEITMAEIQFGERIEIRVGDGKFLVHDDDEENIYSECPLCGERGVIYDGNRFFTDACCLNYDDMSLEIERWTAGHLLRGVSIEHVHGMLTAIRRSTGSTRVLRSYVERIDALLRDCRTKRAYLRYLGTTESRLDDVAPDWLKRKFATLPPGTVLVPPPSEERASEAADRYSDCLDPAGCNDDSGVLSLCDGCKARLGRGGNPCMKCGQPFNYVTVNRPPAVSGITFVHENSTCVVPDVEK